jgi:hypothetical protein
MSDRNPAETALATVREVLRGDEASTSGTTFMRGLTLGALLGAAIAGSAMWQRRAKSKRPTASDLPPESTQGT